MSVCSAFEVPNTGLLLPGNWKEKKLETIKKESHVFLFQRPAAHAFLEANVDKEKRETR